MVKIIFENIIIIKKLFDLITLAPNKKNDFQFGKEKEKDNSANDIIKEKKAFVETQVI